MYHSSLALGLSGAGFRVSDQGSDVQGSGFRVESARFGVHGVVFRVQGAGCRVVPAKLEEKVSWSVESATMSDAISTARRHL